MRILIKKTLTQEKFWVLSYFKQIGMKLSKCYSGLNIFLLKKFHKEWLGRIKSILNKNAVSIYHIVDVLPGSIILKWLTYILLEEVETFSMGSFSHINLYRI